MSCSARFKAGCDVTSGRHHVMPLSRNFIIDHGPTSNYNVD